MTTDEAINNIGKFGKIYANGTLYPKTVHGKLIEVDEENVKFRDNHQHVHTFRTDKVISFEPLDFTNVNK